MEWTTMTKSKSVKATVAVPLPKVSVPTKKTIYMSLQNCNYCKGTGHRIHAMDEFGTYVIGRDGERILACPVLLTKGSLKKPTLDIDAEFPALPGAANVANEATLATIIGINGAVNDKKQRDWSAQKAAKEEARQAWISRYTSRMEAKYGARWYWLVEKTADDNDHAAYCRGEEDQYVDQMKDQYGSSWYIKVEDTDDDTDWAEYFREEERAYINRMYTKYGPHWFCQVRDTEDETECAMLLRHDHQQKLEEEQDRNDMMWEEIHREWDMEDKQKEKEREARRALMTEDEKLEEEEQYMDDLDDALWNATMCERH